MSRRSVPELGTLEDFSPRRVKVSLSANFLKASAVQPELKIRTRPASRDR